MDACDILYFMKWTFWRERGRGGSVSPTCWSLCKWHNIVCSVLFLISLHACFLQDSDVGYKSSSCFDFGEGEKNDVFRLNICIVSEGWVIIFFCKYMNMPWSASFGSGSAPCCQFQNHLALFQNSSMLLSYTWFFRIFRYDCL